VAAAHRVLVTGASGLIGDWLTRLWDVTDTVLVPVERAACNLLNPGVPSKLIETTRPAGLVHLAWCASGDPGYRWSPDNARWADATVELTRAALSLGVRLVLTGTVLDRDASDTSSYAIAKQALRVRLAQDVSDGRLTWIRPFYVFDEHAGRPRLVADALAAKARRRPVHLGSPAARHDFIHAADVARAIATVVRHDLRGEVDIGSGQLRGVTDVVERLGAVWEGDLTSDLDGPAETTANIDRLLDHGWHPVVTNQFFRV
jgi:nucleoside-diphosphate-sugar epimerase